MAEARVAEIGRGDAEHLAERGGEMSVIGKAEIERERVKAGDGVVQHPLGGVEQAQASGVLMNGDARFAFEDAAQVIRRKMDGGGNILEPQVRTDVGVEKGLDGARMFGVVAQGAGGIAARFGTCSIMDAQNFIHRRDDFLFDLERVGGFSLSQ